MLISDTGALSFGLDYPEPAEPLAGKRVLITGVTAQSGIEIARAFAEAGAKVALQCDEDSPVTQAIAESLAPIAAGLSVHLTTLDGNQAILDFARSVVAEFGGLDMVVNVVRLDGNAPRTTASLAEIEARVSETLIKACLVSRVAANRMRMMLREGVVLTVATLDAGATRDERGFAQVVRSTLAEMTRAEAEAWAGDGIRFNAVAPDVLGLVAPAASGQEGDVAKLALYLAAGHAASLSGQTFELGLIGRD